MSRSFRHTPIFGIAADAKSSEKWEKVQQHQKWRAQLRNAMAHEDWERASHDVYESNWTWRKDGRWWEGTPFSSRDFAVHAYRWSINHQTTYYTLEEVKAALKKRMRK